MIYIFSIATSQATSVLANTPEIALLNHNQQRLVNHIKNIILPPWFLLFTEGKESLVTEL